MNTQDWGVTQDFLIDSWHEEEVKKAIEKTKAETLSEVLKLVKEARDYFEEHYDPLYTGAAYEDLIEKIEQMRK